MCVFLTGCRLGAGDVRPEVRVGVRSAGARKSAVRVGVGVSVAVRGRDLGVPGGQVEVGAAGGGAAEQVEQLRDR